MSLNEPSTTSNSRGHAATPASMSVTQDAGVSNASASGKKSNWEVIEHYKTSGEPASLMATTTHPGVGRIDSSRGESSYAQNSYTECDPALNEDQRSDVESIMIDHSESWWNIFSLCARVFRY